MKIIDLNQYISKKKHKTKTNKIAELKAKLKERHKHYYTIQDAEQLAHNILNIYEWDEGYCPVPIFLTEFIT